MNYILISLAGYVLNAGSTILDKILLEKAIPSPMVYVFYINILGVLAIFLLPFVKIEFLPILFSLISGWGFVFAIFFYFKALKIGEASVVAPIIGSLNPYFSLVLGAVFLSQMLSGKQYIAFFIILLGTIILTFNLWFSKVKFNKQLMTMVISGFGFAIAYLSLRQAYLMSDFITGIVFSRIGAVTLVLSFLIFPNLRKQIFSSRVSSNNFANRTIVLLGLGQVMGGLSGLFLAYAVSLANPALVNSLFGAQYIVILIAAMIIGKKHPKLLEENMSRKVLMQKITGGILLGIGVYMLAI